MVKTGESEDTHAQLKSEDLFMYTGACSAHSARVKQMASTIFQSAVYFGSTRPRVRSRTLRDFARRNFLDALAKRGGVAYRCIMGSLHVFHFLESQSS